MKYRAEIDGLRAISVVVVMLFHLGLSFIPGGFVGVDVFFVISGYLISGIIIEALNQGHYSLLWFYERRVRRIFPALLAVLAFCLVAGYALLMPGDYRQATRSALYALFAGSNVFFLQNTGYFDIAADFMPLLHTWSLGVEEQFYILWPLILAGLYQVSHHKRRTLAIFIALFTVAGFAVNLWQTAQVPKTAFFLPHARAWELSIGALITFLPPLKPGRAGRLLAEALPLLGIGLILWASLTLSQNQPYPGRDALYPVLGAALVLYAPGPRVLAFRLLSSPPFTFLGKISYSLYLWHWPLIVFWRHYANGAHPTGREAALLGACALVAAWVSWRWIEQPFRRPGLAARSLFRTVFASALAVALATVPVLATGGLPGRVPEAAQRLGDMDANWTWPCPQTVPLGLTNFADPAPSCVTGADWQTARTHALLWGDSNADHFLQLMDLAGRRTDTAIAQVHPCAAILHEDRVKAYHPEAPDYNTRCARQQEVVLRTLRQHPEIGLILLSARWSTMADLLYLGKPEERSRANGLKLLRSGLEDLLSRIPPGRRVVLMNDIPGIGGDPVACTLANMTLPRRPCDLDLTVKAREWFDGFQRESHVLLREVAAAHPNVTAYSPEDYLCDERRCITTVNGEFLYRDGLHLRRDLYPETVGMTIDLLHLPEMLENRRYGVDAPPSGRSTGP